MFPVYLLLSSERISQHSVHKFGLGKQWLCPILAAVHIIAHATHLKALPNHSIFIYQGTDGSTKLLHVDDITAIMQNACESTYPNPSHYMCLIITGIASHSNRITTAVALWQAEPQPTTLPTACTGNPNQSNTTFTSAPKTSEISLKQLSREPHAPSSNKLLLRLH